MPPKSEVKIVKVGGDNTPIPPVVKAGNKTLKNTKSYPKGILKKPKIGGVTIKAVRDPASPAPLKKNKKGTLRILTDKGIKNRREKIKHTVRNLPESKKKEMLKKSGLKVGETTPKQLVDEILTGAMEAGMIVA